MGIWQENAATRQCLQEMNPPQPSSAACAFHLALIPADIVGMLRNLCKRTAMFTYKLNPLRYDVVPTVETITLRMELIA